MFAIFYNEKWFINKFFVQFLQILVHFIAIFQFLTTFLEKVLKTVFIVQFSQILAQFIIIFFKV